MEKTRNYAAPAGIHAQSAQTGTSDRTRWNGERASAFLRLLARTGKVSQAARAVGMSRQAAYRLRARAPLFAQYWDIAMDQAAAVQATAQRPRRGRKQVHPLLASEPVQTQHLRDTMAPPA